MSNGNTENMLAEKSDEERTVEVNFIEADVERLASLGVLLGHPPAQVHIHNMNMYLPASLS